jgi:hypothetical protein
LLTPPAAELELPYACTTGSRGVFGNVSKEFAALKEGLSR